MNRNLYLGLNSVGASIIGTDGKSVFKYIGMWNNQLKNMEDGKILDFRKPALFFEFIPSTVDSVGSNVQIFDPLLIKCHIIHEFFNASDGTNELNLDIFDIADATHAALQLYQVTGVDYGTSPLNRTEVELDVDHDNLYHHVITYTTTWTDNSTRQPIGGYEIDPPLQLDLTEEKLPLINTPIITVDPTSIDFGNVAFGSSLNVSFTISGSILPDDLIISTSFAIFKVSAFTVFSTRLILSPDNKTIPATTIFVKFTPPSVGDFEGHINYGVPGLNGEITLSGSGV